MHSNMIEALRLVFAEVIDRMDTLKSLDPKFDLLEAERMVDDLKALDYECDRLRKATRIALAIYAARH